jgi:isoleucyl-tRNA synthetase
MKGYYAPCKAGWDCHGLPVELEVEKELGFNTKKDIESYGVAQFNEKCRQRVLHNIKEWEQLTERIGFWLDMEHPYITLDNDYLESCWWIVKQLWDKGLIYEGFKVTPHCPRCGTSLSSHEVALGYKDVEDPSIYVKLKLTKEGAGSIVDNLAQKRRDDHSFVEKVIVDKPIYLLAWTTTPWTLPGNTALAVARDAEYTLVENDEERLILASALWEKVNLESYQVVATMSGADLIRARDYEPLYNPHHYGVERRRPKLYIIPYQQTVLPYKQWELQESNKDLNYSIVPAEFVSLEEGTGIVHIAPAFGEVDFDLGNYKELDFVQPVDLEGRFIGNYPFSGLFVKDADPLIIEDLKSRGLLYRSERISHSYPHCWRCETPLLYYAKPSWYIKTTAVKGELIRGNEEINWHPEHIKYGRFGDWLKNNVDWAFSRERYWGTPLPFWRCESCGRVECIGSIAELQAESGFEKVDDLHRPFVDEITFSCPCGGVMRRVPEVLDCWFDSGAMPLAQWHYPFENKTLLEDGRFPADFISEAVDQTRGWFYSLHALSILLFDHPCFKNVICLGHILDSQGEKMSKSKGNAIDPWLVLKKFGADALRWLLITSAPPGSSRSLSLELVAESMRRFLLTLWNTYSFFVIYANIDEFDPREAVEEYRSGLDRWIISELNQLIEDVTNSVENYDPTTAGRKIEEFVSELSNWYVRRSRRRFWKSENDADKKAAHATLYHCLVILSKLLAPFIPFIAEEMYQNLVCSFYPQAPESVHLTDSPIADKSLIDNQLAADTQLVMKVSSLGRAARSKAGIKVRQPLSRVVVRARGKGDEEGLRRLEHQVLDELNVKEMTFTSNDEFTEPGYTVAAEGGYIVAVATELTPELISEGLAREIVHRLQMMRKQAGFDIADYINSYYQGGARVQQVMEKFAPYIKQETLSRNLVFGSPPNGAYTETHKIAAAEVILAVKK